MLKKIIALFILSSAATSVLAETFSVVVGGSSYPFHSNTGWFVVTANESCAGKTANSVLIKLGKDGSYGRMSVPPGESLTFYSGSVSDILLDVFASEGVACGDVTDQS